MLPAARQDECFQRRSARSIKVTPSSDSVLGKAGVIFNCSWLIVQYIFIKLPYLGNPALRQVSIRRLASFGFFTIRFGHTDPCIYMIGSKPRFLPMPCRYRWRAQMRPHQGRVGMKLFNILFSSND